MAAAAPRDEGRRAVSVLCGLDGSVESHAAARVAKELADGLALRLVLLSVAAPVTEPGVSTAPRGQERLAEEERQQAEKILHDAAREIGAPDAELRVELGHAAKCILRAADEENVGYIVLGTHGRTGVKAALLGSISRDVASQAEVPVVLVPIR
jgi:nucleotide-binding universal stress UspA family protein